MRGKSPQRYDGTVVTNKILGPDNFARLRIEAQQVAHRAERVNLSIGDEWRRARTGWIADSVWAVIFVLPGDPPGRIIETENAFRSGKLAAGERVGRQLGAIRQDAIREIDMVSSHRRTRVAAADGDAPARGRSARGEMIDNAGL